ncbi:MAG: nucleoside deaminase, partial [Rhodobiaceae bacterium]|nr:nucleoside deaminase [Rhodobiaceae bacterium]
MFSSSDSSFMSLAIQEAEKAVTNNEVPVGAIIVQQNKIIGKGRNRVIENQNVSSHAEIEAIID